MYTGAQTKLVDSLSDAIEKWMEVNGEGDEWAEAAGYSGPHVAVVMANAALLPVFYSGEAQRYAIEQELLSDD